MSFCPINDIFVISQFVLVEYNSANETVETKWDHNLPQYTAGGQNYDKNWRETVLLTGQWR